MKASIGRIVHVKLTADCAAQIGGNAREGDLAPAVVVAAFNDHTPPKVNVRLLGDGPGAPLWCACLLQGSGLGEWDWPARVE